MGGAGERLSSKGSDVAQRVDICLSSCMTFLDLTEGDKLAFLIVELHVGRATV